MTDYIDRQAAIAYAISGRIRTMPTSEDGENWIRTAEVRQSLLNVPSEEVEPVKHGRWYKPEGWPKKTYKRKCTHCQGVAYFCGNGDYLYCPNCGARMDAEEGEAHEQN